MIIAISHISHSNYLTWSLNGRCLSENPCADCKFLSYIHPHHIACLTYRELLISLTNKNKLPYTFDTDDYPEVFI